MPLTIPPPTPQDQAAQQRALDLFVKLARAARAIFAATELPIAASGLTPTQFGVLEALLHKGPLSHGELKAKVLTSAANLTDVIDKLEARRLLSRKRETDDGRRICVDLTPLGRSQIAAMFPAHAARITALMSRLDDTEQTTLAILLRKLGLAAQHGQTR